MRSSKAAKPRAKKPAPFVPSFEGPIEGWVVNGMKVNFFRVERTMTREDYLQEAYLVFLRVASRYEVEEPRHLMALYKTAWTNHLNDLATEDTRQRMFAPIPYKRGEDGEEGEMLEPMGEADCDGTLAIMLRQAPADVQAVLNLFLKAPQELVDAALSSWHGRDRRYACGGSKQINRLLGLDPKVDVLQRVEEYFAPA